MEPDRQHVTPATDPAPDTGPNPADYDTEPAVDLRGQRLRRADTRPDPPADPPGTGEHTDTGRAAVAPVVQARSAVVVEAPGVETDPAEWGWRGRLNSLGGRLRPPVAGGEVAYRRAVARIGQPLAGTGLVMVANTKGGTGVTPATVVLANLFGRHRGGGVVAWDNTESGGTLAARAATGGRGAATVWDVLAHARELCSPDAPASGVNRYLAAQPSFDDVLAGDTAARSASIGAGEAAAIWAVLARYRSMSVVDTAHNPGSGVFGWTVANASALVVPLLYRRDATYSVLRMLDTITAHGRGDLVATAVVVLARTRVDPAVRAAVHTALEHAGITRIATVPFDPVLAGGDRIVLSRLGETTVRAWTRVAATVADTLAHTPIRAGEPGESLPLPEQFRTRSRAGERCRRRLRPTPDLDPSSCPGARYPLPRTGRPYTRRRP